MNLLLLLGMPGPTELLILAFLVLLLFGGKKLPELMKGLGKGLREFNNAKANIESEVRDSLKDAPSQKAEPKSGWIERND
jgi:sec-independent protein translocase protein TatA